MTVSVHTNTSAMIALQQLNKTNEQLEQVQTRINSGFKVNGAKDNASIWAVAQGQRADIGALSAVKMSLDRATSISDVSLTAGESISDLLLQIKEKVVAAMDPSIDVNSRTALNADYKSLLRQIASITDNAEFVAWVNMRTPMKRWGDPAKLAGIAVFLASDAASYLTGQTIYVDGGMSVNL